MERAWNFGLGSSANTSQSATVAVFSANPLDGVGVARCVDEARAFAHSFLKFSVGGFCAWVVGIGHHLELLLELVQLAGIGGRIGRFALFMEQDFLVSDAGWDDPIGFVVERARICAARAIDMALDAFVELEGFVIGVLIGQQRLRARAYFFIRRFLCVRSSLRYAGGGGRRPQTPKRERREREQNEQGRKPGDSHGAP